MKIPSTFLYDLVHSLSKSEKRYLKVQSGTKTKDYIQFMDALIGQKAFDEEQLIKDNQGANFLKHLAVNKRYLYEIILQSLSHFGKKTLEDKILEKVKATNALIEKNLFSAAFSELRKGQKIAEKYEMFELQMMLCAIEKRLLGSPKLKGKYQKTIHQVYDMERNNLIQLTNTNEYWYLAQQIAEFQRRYQKIQNETQQKEIDDLIQSPKFHTFSLATNFRSQLHFYQANATYQFTLGHVEKAYEINASYLSLLDAYPHFLKIYAERYLATLNNMLIDSLVIGKYDILEEGINRLAKTAERPEFKSIKNIESRIFRQRYLLLINWSLSQQDFEKALDWIPAIEEGLNQFGKKIERHHRITFYYLVTYLLFLNKKYDKALQWNFLILNETKEDVVKEIFFFSRIINLLIHFELGNYNLLESLLLSTPKYLKARRSIYKTEKALFKYLRKILNTFSKKEQRLITSEFKNKIQELSKTATEKRVFNYLDLRLWINGKTK